MNRSCQLLVMYKTGEMWEPVDRQIIVTIKVRWDYGIVASTEFFRCFGRQRYLIVAAVDTISTVPVTLFGATFPLTYTAAVAVAAPLQVHL